jgi:glutaredoxin-like protein
MLLDPKVIKTVKDRFANLQEKVKIIFFTQEVECQFCRENRSLYDELTTTSDKIDLEIYDSQKNRIKAEEYKIEQIPATVIMGDKDYGIRFYGVPGGHEFFSLIDDLIMISRKDTGLSAGIKNRLQDWTKPTRIKVFVTLTCPYCPQAVRTAHKLAFENKFISAEMIDVGEFPHLANKYQVFGVPKVIINEKVKFEGALPEEEFVDRLMEA